MTIASYDTLLWNNFLKKCPAVAVKPIAVVIQANAIEIDKIAVPTLPHKLAQILMRSAVRLMLFGNTTEAEAPACSNPPYTSKSPAAAINPAERLIFNSDFLSEYPRSLILLMIIVANSMAASASIV